ncbi:MAG: hypothetical protein IPH53_18430 [Flavobacteriales bacterium]|nr:hypothetical protein [Flavobacteriales bacterium]
MLGGHPAQAIAISPSISSCSAKVLSTGPSCTRLVMAGSMRSKRRYVKLISLMSDWRFDSVSFIRCNGRGIDVGLVLCSSMASCGDPVVGCKYVARSGSPRPRPIRRISNDPSTGRLRLYRGRGTTAYRYNKEECAMPDRSNGGGPSG